MQQVNSLVTEMNLQKEVPITKPSKNNQSSLPQTQTENILPTSFLTPLPSLPVKHLTNSTLIPCDQQLAAIAPSSASPHSNLNSIDSFPIQEDQLPITSPSLPAMDPEPSNYKEGNKINSMQTIRDTTTPTPPWSSS